MKITFESKYYKDHEMKLILTVRHSYKICCWSAKECIFKHRDHAGHAFIGLGTVQTYGPRFNESCFEACSSFDGLKRQKKIGKKSSKKNFRKKISKNFSKSQKKFSTDFFFVQNGLKCLHKHFQNI